MTRVPRRERAILWIAFALAIYVSSRLLPLLPGLSEAGQGVLGVVFAGVAFWVSEAVPLGVTALLVLALLGTVPSGAGTATFVGFASPVVFFLIGAVALGTAVEASGLAGGRALFVQHDRGHAGRRTGRPGNRNRRSRPPGLRRNSGPSACRSGR